MVDFSKYGGIVEAGAALREYYGLPASAPADPDISVWLNGNSFRCVAVLLVDAMGISIMEKHLEKDDFFMRHLKKEMMTVFPPTTAAATTAFLTGKYPKETAWLGWHQYFKEADDSIILFFNRGQYSQKEYGDFSYRTLPVKLIFDELNENDIPAESVWPSWGAHNPCSDYHVLCERTLEAVSDPDIRFVYAYWDVLDTYMHESGPSCEGTGDMVRMIRDETEKTARQLPADCGLLVIADHSQIEVRHYPLEEDTELCKCFRHLPAIEARSMAFYIKEDMRERFEELFRKKFKDDYILFTHADVLRLGIFGKGTAHERFEEFTGDYLAVSISDLQLDYRKGTGMKGNHAGGLTEEALIPLILYP